MGGTSEPSNEGGACNLVMREGACNPSHSAMSPSLLACHRGAHFNQEETIGVLWRDEVWHWDLFAIIIEYHQGIGGGPARNTTGGGPPKRARNRTSVRTYCGPT